MDPNVRRLAAVWFADIVGFTRLSSSDEPAALRLVALFQAAARSATAAHGGRLVHFMGDAALAEFNSTDAAMKAAVRLQREFGAAAAQAGQESALRIGVHVGDVVQSPDGDVFGDGVNTAARLQELARPGQIVCSQDVWRHLRPRGEFAFDSLGERQLAGITGRVWVFSVREGNGDGEAAVPAGSGAAVRSVRIFRLLLIYLAAGVVVYQLTQVLTTTLDLPSWVTPLALLLLAVGLLVVLVTGWVQSRPTWERRVDEKTAWTLDFPDLLDALQNRRLPQLTWPRALVGGALAFGLLFLLVSGSQYLRNGGRAPLVPQRAFADPGLTLAVLPFHTEGEGAAQWGEGMPDLLGLNLGGVGIPVLDMLAVTSLWELQPDDGTIETAVRLGRQLDARFVLAGGVRADGERLHFTTRLYDVARNRLLDTIQVSGSPDSFPALADSLGTRVLRAGLLPDGVEAPVLNLRRHATSEQTALRPFLEGERQFRRSRWAEAKAAFSEAVEADPRFTFALYRLSLTSAWASSRHEPVLDRYARLTEGQLDGLSERQALLIRAHSQLARNQREAITTLRELTEKYPGDVEGWFLLGDAYYHLAAASDSFRIALGRATELDPSFAPAYFHLIEYAVDHNDTAKAGQLIAAYRQIDPRSPWLSGFDAAYQLAQREREAARAADSLSGPDATTPTREVARPPEPDRSGYNAALAGADAARREALSAGAAGPRLASADSVRVRGIAEARRGRLGSAEDLLDRARLRYDEARAGAVWAARLDSVRNVLAPARRAATGSPDFANASALETSAADAERSGRYVEALQQLESALRAYRNARPAPVAAAPRQVEPEPTPTVRTPSPDAVRSEIEQSLARIAQAIEGEDMNRLVAAWPSLDATQRSSLSALFTGTRDIDVRFDIRELAIGDDQVTATLHTTYAYYNEVDRKNETTSAAQVFVFTRRDGQWVVTSSR